MSKLTDLQFKFMNLIAHHEMNSNNGATPKSHEEVNTWLWADEFAAELGINEHQLGGVISSLKVAGHIWTVDEQTDEAGVGFTKSGFEAWAAAYCGE